MSVTDQGLDEARTCAAGVGQGELAVAVVACADARPHPCGPPGIHERRGAADAA